ncbi:ATP-binding protein [Halochromatium salexigens]|uniref:AAA family ATPase n=1 Tax=Halochromatium salexigens TaxID=49447 RepID=A0AAJ0UGP8_HALSE|nr:ATP-binding protein [Halochromatium salexigens]MBK5931159.1 AAA family ATPase [Halochromatium salexigens]
MAATLDQFLIRLDALLDRIEPWLPVPTATDWNAIAWRWRKDGPQGQHGRGRLEAIRRPHQLRLEDLRGIDRQRDEIDRNTRQFLAGASANNVLLSGSRGTGKSSLIKALLNRYQAQGLRLIEVDKDDLTDLPAIIACVEDRPERFILYCDDLSFEASESGYKALKAALDGSLSAPPENLLIYATSNRRHLLPEYQHENQAARMNDGEIHQGEGVEEKISLSDRFGLWLSFYPFSQEQYLEVVRHWLEQLGVGEPAGATEPVPATAPDATTSEQAALQWALRRGSRSGRTAWQFARDWAGRQHGDARLSRR